MPIEFLHGRPLEPEELEAIRLQLESGFDHISSIDPERYAGSLSGIGRIYYPSFRPRMLAIKP